VAVVIPKKTIIPRNDPNVTRGVRVPTRRAAINREILANRAALGNEPSTLEAIGISADQNITNRLAEGENTLLSAAQKALETNPALLFHPAPMRAPPVFSEQEIADTGKFVDQRKAATRAQIEENNRLTEPLREQQPGAVFTGDALTFLAEISLGGGSPKLAQRGGKTLRAVLGGGKEATIGAAFGATETVRSDEEKARLVAFGLITGGITPGVFEGIKKIRGIDNEARILELLQMEDDLGMSGLLTVGELRGVLGFLKMEAGLDNIPLLGLGGKRDQQRAMLMPVAENLAQRISGGVYTKDDVLNGLLRKYEANKRIVDAKFDELEALDAQLDAAEQFGAIPGVSSNNLREAARELLKDEVGIRAAFQDTEVLSMLRKLAADDSQVTFKGARDTMSRILEKIRVATAQSGRGEKTDAPIGVLSQLQAAHQRDIADWAEAVGGEPLRKWDEAKEAFIDLLLPFRKSPTLADGVRGRVDEFTIDAFVADFIKADSPRRTAAMMSSLDSGGQAAAQFLLIREAFERATPAGVVDVRKFRKSLESLSQAWKVSFTPEQKKLLTGYIRLAGLADRAFNKPQAIGALIATGSVATLGLGVVGSVTAGRFLFGTEGGRRLLAQGATARTNKELRQIAAAAQVGITRSISNLSADQAAEVAELYRELEAR